MTEVFETTRAAELRDAPVGQAQFLVHGLWTRAAVGIIGGAPKCCKSWLGLDLAVSVASGTACLGQFSVTGGPGRVLLYMAEDDAPAVKARITGIAASRQLDLAGLDIHVITAPRLRLDDARDRDRLAATVAATRPRLLLLDPFIRLHTIDENDAGAVAILLGYLRELQRLHELAVVVTHHARKDGGTNPGADLRGSSEFFAWADSLLYLRRAKDKLHLAAQHRSAPAPEPMTVALVSGNRPPHLQVVTGAPSPEPAHEIDDTVLDALRSADRPLPREKLRAALRMRNERLGAALSRLQQRGDVQRINDCWTSIPVPAP